MKIRGTSVGKTESESRRVVGVGGSSSSGKQQQDPLSSSMFSSTKLKYKSSTSTSTAPISLSSSPRHKNNFPVWHSFSDADDSDWVSVDPTQDNAHADADAPRGFSGRFIGHAPSESEVDDAVSSLQRVLGPASHVQFGMSSQVSEDGSETDWAEPSAFPYNSIMLQANRSDRFNYAIHLLQTDPSVQRIVKSLSTDEAVWEAVLNNDIVRELRESFSADQERPDGIANNDPHNTTNVVMWVLNTAKAKFMQVIEKITKIVIDLFQHKFSKTAAPTEDSEPLNEKLRTSFMLSIMVLLIVVVSRVHS